MREEVRQILGGADEAYVSADGRLAFAVLKEMGAVQFESAAASNVAASNNVANNQQPVAVACRGTTGWPGQRCRRGCRRGGCR